MMQVHTHTPRARAVLWASTGTQEVAEGHYSPSHLCGTPPVLLPAAGGTAASASTEMLIRYKRREEGKK